MSQSRDQDIYAKRQQALLKKVKPNSMIILPASPVRFRNRDIEYSFRQDSSFYYMTGFEEPEAIAIFLKNDEGSKYILFNRPKDPSIEIIHGRRAGQKEACEKYGADESYSFAEFEDKLPGLLDGITNVYFPTSLKNNDKTIEKFVLDSIETTAMKDIMPIISEMRLIKDKHEINLIKKSIAISERGHLQAMKKCKPGLHEYQLEAELMHEFLDQGSRGLAYPNIVAAGKNANYLHYMENNKQIKDGDLVLIDAGGEYKNYSSDITRTFPANGKFTEEQRKIYNLVLNAQEAGIKAVKPGASWANVEMAVQNILTKGLIELGLLKANPKKPTAGLDQFYMHSAGHWMGLDVHDVGSYSTKFKPGMILTVEPGIYIKPSKDIDKCWHDINVRIEDDILVTSTGHEVLSKHLPKKIDEIEKIMNTHQNTLTSTAKSMAVLHKEPAKKKPTTKHTHPRESKNTEKLETKHSLFDSPKIMPREHESDAPIAHRLRPRIKYS